jgi:hypothetical protein
MNDLTERPAVGDGYRFRSQSGRRLADLLSSCLRAPLVWDYYAAPMEVGAVDGAKFVYQPDFVIRNAETGRTLFVELQSVYGLSLYNLVTFNFVNAAVRRAGDDFLLLVEGVADSDAIQRHLTDSDIDSVWFRDGVDSGAIAAIHAALKPVG